MDENEIWGIIVDAAIKIHSELGPGLLESVYKIVLERELQSRGLTVERQVPVEIEYNGLTFNEGFRADIIVEDKVIVELKSQEQINKVNFKQVFTHIKLSDRRLGYLLNFGAPLMREGIRRVVNGL